MKTIFTALTLVCTILLCSCANIDECNDSSCSSQNSNYKNFNIYTNEDDDWFNPELLKIYVDLRATDEINAHFDSFSSCEQLPKVELTNPLGNCSSWIQDTNIKPNRARLRTSGRAIQICKEHLDKIFYNIQKNAIDRNRALCAAEERAKPPSATELKKLELEKLKRQKEDDEKNKMQVARREALLVHQQQMQSASKNRSLKTSDYYIGLICSYPVNGGMAAQLVSTWLPMIANPNAMQNMMTTDSGKFCKLTYARPSLEVIKNAALVNLDEQHSYFVVDRDPVAIGIVGPLPIKK